jgi:hypothetical protein
MDKMDREMMEGAMSLNRHDAQRDANEPEIVEALLKAGCSVDRTKELVDLVVGHYDEIGWPVTTLMEVKLPLGPNGGDSHSRLNPKQMEFHGRHKGLVVVVRSPEDALRAVGKLPSAIVSRGCR